jgi:hypothetical protein
MSIGYRWGLDSHTTIVGRNTVNKGDSLNQGIGSMATSRSETYFDHNICSMQMISR